MTVNFQKLIIPVVFCMTVLGSVTKQVKFQNVPTSGYEFWGLVRFAEGETYPLSLKRTNQWVSFET